MSRRDDAEYLKDLLDDTGLHPGQHVQTLIDALSEDDADDSDEQEEEEED